MSQLKQERENSDDSQLEKRFKTEQRKVIEVEIKCETVIMAFFQELQWYTNIDNDLNVIALSIFKPKFMKAFLAASFKAQLKLLHE